MQNLLTISFCIGIGMYSYQVASQTVQIKRTTNLKIRLLLGACVGALVGYTLIWYYPLVGTAGKFVISAVVAWVISHLLESVLVLRKRVNYYGFNAANNKRT